MSLNEDFIGQNLEKQSWLSTKFFFKTKKYTYIHLYTFHIGSKSVMIISTNVMNSLHPLHCNSFPGVKINQLSTWLVFSDPHTCQKRFYGDKDLNQWFITERKTINTRSISQHSTQPTKLRLQLVLPEIWNYTLHRSNLKRKSFLSWWWVSCK